MMENPTKCDECEKTYDWESDEWAFHDEVSICHQCDDAMRLAFAEDSYDDYPEDY